MSEVYESAQKALAAADLSDALKDQRLLNPDTLEGALQAAFCDGWKRAREHVCPECFEAVPWHRLSCSEVAASPGSSGVTDEMVEAAAKAVRHELEEVEAVNDYTYSESGIVEICEAVARAALAAATPDERKE